MTVKEFIAEWQNDSDRLLVHTSGSTGIPKPMWVEKKRMAASARITCQFLGLKEGDAALLCMPLDYIAGKMMVVRALTCGLQLYSTAPGKHPLSAAQLPADAQPFALVAMVPLQVYHTLQVPEERDRLRQVRHLLIGGGAIDEQLAEVLRDFPHAVWSTYGMTETLSHIALRRLNGPQRSDYYTPFDGVSVSLGDDDCLIINAPAVCDRLLVTNDRAELHPDGRRFRILGRLDNVVCTGGIKLQIEELEQQLRPHIDVPFMLTKRKDPALGEALVMLTEDTDTAKYDALCRAILNNRYAIPKNIIAVSHIPRTATGKPARRQAEELANQSAHR